jgi:hypothetical protein
VQKRQPDAGCLLYFVYNKKKRPNPQVARGRPCFVWVILDGLREVGALNRYPRQDSQENRRFNPGRGMFCSGAVRQKQNSLKMTSKK